MGSKCSKETFTGSCDCFGNDSIQNVSVIRYVTADWIWSTRHDAALVQTLSDHSHHVPNEIIYLVKDHTFHESQPHSLTLPTLRRERCCPTPKQLLRRKLCPHWYSQNNFKTQSFVTALHVSDVTQSERIFECVSTETLPSLQLESQLFLDTYDQINRTMLLDHQPIRLKAVSIDNRDDIHPIMDADASDIHLVIANVNDSLYAANKTFKALQSNSMHNCILVKVAGDTRNTSSSCRSNSLNSKAMDSLATYLNIPCVTISFHKPKTILSLFHFAVKYHWFCSVTK